MKYNEALEFLSKFKVKKKEIYTNYQSWAAMCSFHKTDTERYPESR